MTEKHCISLGTGDEARKKFVAMAAEYLAEIRRLYPNDKGTTSYADVKDWTHPKTGEILFPIIPRVAHLLKTEDQKDCFPAVEIYTKGFRPSAKPAATGITARIRAAVGRILSGPVARRDDVPDWMPLAWALGLALAAAGAVFFGSSLVSEAQIFRTAPGFPFPAVW